MIDTTENRDEPRADTNAAAPIAARMPTNIAMPPSLGRRARVHVALADLRVQAVLEAQLPDEHRAAEGDERGHEGEREEEGHEAGASAPSSAVERADAAGASVSAGASAAAASTSHGRLGGRGASVVAALAVARVGRRVLHGGRLVLGRDRHGLRGFLAVAGARSSPPRPPRCARGR
jgi:hypothetical protein